MINQMFGQREIAALSRRVARQKRLDAIRSSETTRQIKYALKMLALAFAIVFLLAANEIITHRGESRTIPAEQTSGQQHWRN